MVERDNSLYMRNQRTTAAKPQIPFGQLITPILAALLIAACGSGGSTPTDPATEAPPAPETPDNGSPGSPTDIVEPPENDNSRGLLGLDERSSNLSCLAPQRQVVSSDAKLQRVWPNLSFENPTKILQAPPSPGNPNRWYVLEQAGKILTFDGTSNDVSSATVALDYTAGSGSEVEVDASQDAGMLGMAFHPDFATSGEAFLSYTVDPNRSGIKHESHVTRILSFDGGLTLDTSTETMVMSVDQRRLFHNVGDLGFGPDGYMYIGSGDGGGAGDRDNLAQNPDTVLGKFLRIDVDSASPYGIPPDNPYANGGGRAEVFALGLRNPWRWSFDRLTGDLWAGDVGQAREEEISLIRKGENYGWRCYEGSREFNTEGCLSEDAYTAPVISYGTDDGESVTGGYVYRGTQNPGLYGDYIYGDFVSGTIWALRPDGSGGYIQRELLRQNGLGLASFGEGYDGELYVVDYFGGGLYKIVPDNGGESADGPAATLSATGCVDPANPSIAAPGVVPYEVRHAFWSDGASKERFVAIPDESSIGLTDTGDFDFPINTVLMKNFRLSGQLIETRLFVRHDDGGWEGYSYEWNDSQTDAMLLPGAKQKQFGDQVWHYPSRGQCLQCHTEASGFSLGLEVRQLDTRFNYPTTQRDGNQIDTLHHVGLLSDEASESTRDSLLQAVNSESATLSERARSYLHANCSSCHQPGGTTRASIDLRYDTLMAQTGACNSEPGQSSLGITNPKIIAEGQPENSVLLARMKAKDANRMPPIGNTVTDQAGVDLITEWITAGADC